MSLKLKQSYQFVGHPLSKVTLMERVGEYFVGVTPNGSVWVFNSDGKGRCSTEGSYPQGLDIIAMDNIEIKFVFADACISFWLKPSEVTGTKAYVGVFVKRDKEKPLYYTRHEFHAMFGTKYPHLMRL